MNTSLRAVSAARCATDLTRLRPTAVPPDIGTAVRDLSDTRIAAAPREVSRREPCCRTAVRNRARGYARWPRERRARKNLASREGVLAGGGLLVNVECPSGVMETDFVKCARCPTASSAIPSGAPLRVYSTSERGQVPQRLSVAPARSRPNLLVSRHEEVLLRHKDDTRCEPRRRFPSSKPRSAGCGTSSACRKSARKPSRDGCRPARATLTRTSDGCSLALNAVDRAWRRAGSRRRVGFTWRPRPLECFLVRYLVRRRTTVRDNKGCSRASFWSEATRNRSRSNASS